jgi:predicted dienelactone hydrolase
MIDPPPKASFDFTDDTVMLSRGPDEDCIWFRAEDIQSVVTSLLQAHSDYVDAIKRRSEGAKD